LSKFTGSWDKRIQFSQWVGFARMALLRAKRRQEGLSGLPDTKLTTTSSGRDVTYLQDLISAFDEHTESVAVLTHVTVSTAGTAGRPRL
jgi:hypothetical protein